MMERTEPVRGADERALLDGWLDYYRATLEHKCSGLGPERLVERSCRPSSMSLIGLVRHMTEMERTYAQRLPLLYCTDESPDGDFDDVSPQQAVADLGTYADHCARSRESLASRELDDTLRWLYLYLVKEYARHLGHADLLRERVDGATGE